MFGIAGAAAVQTEYAIPTKGKAYLIGKYDLVIIIPLTGVKGNIQRSIKVRSKRFIPQI
jgi:hypothetical protein